jgi:G3E family GTPase
VVDSVNGLANAETYPEARRQLAVADTVIITKQDLRKAKTPESIGAFIRTITPDAAIADSQAPGFELGDFVEKTAIASPRRSNFIAEEASHQNGWTSFTIPIPERLDWPVFTLWLSALLYAHGAKILRVKGMVRTTTSGGPLIIHGVQHVMHPPTHLKPEEDSGQNGFLVFITDGLNRNAIENSLYNFQGHAGLAKRELDACS